MGNLGDFFTQDFKDKIAEVLDKSFYDMVLFGRSEIRLPIDLNQGDNVKDMTFKIKPVDTEYGR